jgi:DNA polymerase-1
MNILLLDGYNLLYRARSGYTKGDHAIVYNFFRSFRALVEKFSPDLIYFVLEGIPKKRLELASDYKGQRVYHDKDGFQSQKSEIISVLKDKFPIKVVRHPDYECDDVLANLVMYAHKPDSCTVVSSDTDFYQLYNTCNNVKVYNPIRKEFIEPPKYDYVMWKALRGDACDNIPGFRGVGDKTALKIMENDKTLENFLSVAPDENRREKFDKNISLIRFHSLDKDEVSCLEWSNPSVDWKSVRAYFETLGFNSIINEKSWKKFVDTFSCLHHLLDTNTK